MIDCSYLLNQNIDSVPFFEFTPKNIISLLCCVASSHRMVEQCLNDDFYRLNTHKNVRVPLVFIPDGVTIALVPGSATNSTANSLQGNRKQALVEFYVLQSYDVRNKQRSKLDLKDQCYLIASDIIEKIDIYTNTISKNVNSIYWKVSRGSEKYFPISEFDNSERFGMDLVGYRIEFILEGINPYNNCDTRFEEFNCINCNKRLIPLPDPCCDFEADLLVTETGLEVVISPILDCSLDEYNYEFRVNNITVQNGTSNIYLTTVENGVLYDVIITNGECQEIVSYSNPVIPCCDNFISTISYNEITDILFWGVEWIDFSAECRFALSEFLIERYNTATQEWEIVSSSGIYENPEPGTYRSRTVLIYGCEEISETFIIGQEDCCSQYRIQVQFDDPAIGDGVCISVAGNENDCITNVVSAGLIKDLGFTQLIYAGFTETTPDVFCRDEVGFSVNKKYFATISTDNPECPQLEFEFTTEPGVYVYTQQ